MAIGFAVKHNRLPLKRLLFCGGDTVFSEEGVEVGAVDVDFAADLREGDEALVAVILPRLEGDAKEFAGGFGFLYMISFIRSFMQRLHQYIVLFLVAFNTGIIFLSRRRDSCYVHIVS